MNLKLILDGILADKTLEPHDGKTFCNLAVRRALMNFGYTGFGPEMMANDMVWLMRDNVDFEKIDGEKAAELANAKELVIAGMQFVRCEEVIAGKCFVDDKTKCPYCRPTRDPDCQVICGIEHKPVQMRRLSHGHVASVHPAPIQYSASWDKKVPMVANVGAKNGLMRASQAFPVEPDYFLLKKMV